MPIQATKTEILMVNGVAILPPTTADQITVESMNKKLEEVLNGYSADLTLINGELISLVSNISNIETKTNQALTLAQNAMPKGGGTFTGDVIATNANRVTDSVRNIAVLNSAGSASVSTNKILMLRK